MKTLKQLFFKSFMLASIFLFISCSGDDDSNNNAPSIFGTWKYIGYVENGEYFNDVETCYSEVITINNNNTGQVAIEDCDFGDQTIGFTWENISGNKYNISAMGETTPVTITFPSGNDIMHFTTDDDPTYSDVYQRQ